MITGLNHVNLVVADIKRALPFYRNVLGFEVADDVTVSDPQLSIGLGVPDAALRAVFLRIPGTSTQIEMMEYSSHKGTPAGPSARAFDGGFRHIAFQVDDVDRVFSALKAHGVSFVSDPVTVPGGTRFVWFKDPDGNVLELIRPG